MAAMTPVSPFPTSAIPNPMANDDELMTPPQWPSSLSLTSVPSLDDLDHFPHLKLPELPTHLPPHFIIPHSFVLDFFYHATIQSTPSHTLEEYLRRSWSEDPLTTLKLVCYLRRSTRKQGESDKEGFYAAVLWIHTFHPKTLAYNLETFVKFGYFKDLPEILYRLLEGCDVRVLQKRELEERTENRIQKLHSQRLERQQQQGGGVGNGRRRRKSGSMMSRKEKIEKKRIAKEIIENKRSERSVIPMEERIAKEKAKVEMEMMEARKIRHQKRAAAAKKATDRYNYDPNYRFLHDQISDLFAQRLKSDLECLNSGKLQQIGLAAKWCPSLDSSHDRSTLLCQSIARRMFPEEDSDEENTVRVRDRLRREVLVPLRRALEIPEVFMTSNRWDEVSYNRVASVAMTKYRKLFLQHDKERFSSHLKNKKQSDRNKKNKRKMKTNPTTVEQEMLPHQVIENLDSVDGEKLEEAELQWKRIVSDVSKTDKLNNSIAVCDVKPWGISDKLIQVSAALSLLVSDLSHDPWKGKMPMTLDYVDVRVRLIQGDSFKEKIKFIRESPAGWYSNLNLKAVFDQLLEIAVDAGLSKEEMVKRVFVFGSDSMESYDYHSSWEIDYEEIKRRFGEKGYAVPEIVYWNLACSRAMPVKEGKIGMACVGGYSTDLLNMFIGVTNPMEVMEAAVAGEEYQRLAIFD